MYICIYVYIYIGVVHSFDGSLEEMHKLTELGLYIGSFTYRSVHIGIYIKVHLLYVYMWTFIYFREHG
jgi:hypothetical protein